MFSRETGMTLDLYQAPDSFFAGPSGNQWTALNHFYGMTRMNR